MISHEDVDKLIAKIGGAPNTSAMLHGLLAERDQAIADRDAAYRRGQEEMKSRAHLECKARWIAGADAAVMGSYVRDLPINGDP